MPHWLQAGEVLASRYRLDDLLDEHESGRFWRGWDQVLSRPVAIHVVPVDHPHAARMLEAARGSAGLHDRRLLRVLDAAEHDGVAYVVNEWGQGSSLDVILVGDGPLQPRQAAFVVAEVADILAAAHEAGLSHGRLGPEQVLVDRNGDIRLIGFAVNAALHGLPADRAAADVADLAGLLYAGLTGRWPGQTPSDVPPAPHENGSVLRPRRVRAGVPRPLDGLCDQVLNPHTPHHHARAARSTHDLTTARGIADELADFVGDPSGLVLPTPSHPGPTAGAAETAAASAAGPAGSVEERTQQMAAADEPTADEPTAAEPVAEEPTQAGLPVFHDETDDVSWARVDEGDPERPQAPAPPPAPEEEEERPLFAPEPPAGEPVRRARRESAGPAADSWPWGDRDAGTGAASAALPAYSDGWGGHARAADDWGHTPTGELEAVPGRSWLRLALVVGLCVLVLVAAVAAYQLGGGGGLGLPEPEEETTSSSPTQTPEAEPTPFTGLEASAFDPQGDPPGQENPESVPLALDGDPTTAWRTATYFDQLGPPPGLKTGVGLTLDLGHVREVRRVELTFLNGSTAFSLYVTEDPPTSTDGLTPVVEEQAEGTITLDLDEPATGRYVTVWLTGLPQVEGGFRGEIAEVEVAG